MLLLEAGIDPLIHMSYVPSRYLFKDQHISKVIIPNSIHRIGALAFAKCKVETIEMPNSIIEIVALAFANNQQPITINYAGTKTDWNNIKKDASWNNDSDITVHTSDSTLTY